ncbi:MAG: MiaB/RimO family radical SAM methylthiotransferase, partial [Acutalibacteraceae bacterium]
LNCFKREHPNAVIVLTGCMVQAMGEKAQEITGADIIAGNTDIRKIVSLVEEYRENVKKIVEICPHTGEESFNTPGISSFAEHTRAFMKIEDGCERFCTYCIIPYARGFVRSKPPEEIYKEAAELAKNGYLEIVLVGINLSSYGKDNGLNLCDAVDTVCRVDGIKRVRLGSLEPDHISDEMLNRLKAQDKFCPQFHLSLQSGCDATLKRMNRHYDTAFYFDLVQRIRKIFPDAAISTDIMVGFPGETEQEFSESIGFLKKIGFARTHVFAYSRRSGTMADKMPDQIPKAVKTARSREMIAAATVCEQEFLKAQIGKEVSVLFETFEDGVAFGYTKNYIRVGVAGTQSLSGQIKNVKITKALSDRCEGVPV